MHWRSHRSDTVSRRVTGETGSAVDARFTFRQNVQTRESPRIKRIRQVAYATNALFLCQRQPNVALAFSPVNEVSSEGEELDSKKSSPRGLGLHEGPAGCPRFPRAPTLSRHLAKVRIERYREGFSALWYGSQRVVEGARGRDLSSSVSNARPGHRRKGDKHDHTEPHCQYVARPASCETSFAPSLPVRG